MSKYHSVIALKRISLLLVGIKNSYLSIILCKKINSIYLSPHLLFPPHPEQVYQISYIHFNKKNCQYFLHHWQFLKKNYLTPKDLGKISYKE